MPPLRDLCLVASSVLNLVFVVPYAHGVLRGSVRPNRVSWFLWLLLGVASLLAVLKAGGRREAVFNLVLVFGEALVFALSLAKGETRFSRLDAASLAGGALSLALLFALKNPLVSLFAVVATDLFGFIPTWAKSWREPQSESLSTFAITFAASLLGFAAVAGSAWVYTLYPLYLALGSGVEVAILLHRRRAAAPA